MRIHIRKFNELELQELYELLQLRTEVFVVEQNCVYQDLDGKDQEALHLLGIKDGKVIAYTRCFPPGSYFKEPAIGRVVVKSSERMKSYGHQILKASIVALEERFEATSIKISAQIYLQSFYEYHGFQRVGEGYLEDGIPHIAMLRN